MIHLKNFVSFKDTNLGWSYVFSVLVFWVHMHKCVCVCVWQREVIIMPRQKKNIFSYFTKIYLTYDIVQI